MKFFQWFDSLSVKWGRFSLFFLLNHFRRKVCVRRSQNLRMSCHSDVKCFRSCSLHYEYSARNFNRSIFIPFTLKTGTHKYMSAVFDMFINQNWSNFLCIVWIWWVMSSSIKRNGTWFYFRRNSYSIIRLVKWDL